MWQRQLLEKADILLDIDMWVEQKLYLLQVDSLGAATAQLLGLNTGPVPVDKTVVGIAGSVGTVVAAVEDGRGRESRMLKVLTQLAVLMQEEWQGQR